MHVLSTFAAFCCVGWTVSVMAAENHPLLYSDDFENGNEGWTMPNLDPSARLNWKIVSLKNVDGEPTKALRITGPSDYQPPYRSPLSILLRKEAAVGDFELTARVQSTKVNAGPHRDMCVFWGYQDPAHFYYVHFGAKSDPNACQIFIVNGAPRKPITLKQAKGTPWTIGWHQVRVTRRIADGSIEVYFDDMDEPMMTARDNTFNWGQVGVGTFDDHGNWDDFVLKGVKAGPENHAAN